MEPLWKFKLIWPAQIYIYYNVWYSQTNKTFKLTIGLIWPLGNRKN